MYLVWLIHMIKILCYHLGYFDNEDDAHAAWVTARKEYLQEVAENSNLEIKKMILNYMECEFK